VIDKAAGGKSDALNAGLNFCHTPWVCCVDADSILEGDALLRLMRPAIEDNTVVAAGGIVRIANGCRISSGRVLRAALPPAKLAVFQVVEYLRGFLQGRLGWSGLHGLSIISGAFGAFRTEVLRSVGGYSTSIAAEDMEIVIRIHKYFREQSVQYKVVFMPDAVCWTEVPAKIAALRRQRRRWQRGLAQVLALHRNLILRSRLGVVGLLALPYFTLELLAPIVELLGFGLVPLAWGFGRLSQAYLFLYLIFAILLGISFTLCALAIEEFAFKRYSSWHDLLRLLLYAVIEGLGYHQLVLWWRLEGMYDYFRGRRQWGEQVRVGFRRRRTRERPGTI
jgi:cellulose synthase/poly-beta-1,6-N-acetylglucosamine synthase-like glycosyltransferase